MLFLELTTTCCSSQCCKSHIPCYIPTVTGEDDALPSHQTLDPSHLQHLPISALSLPVSNLYPAALPRQSPPPLSALPTHMDQHDFGYSHTLPPNSTHQQHSSYPHASYPNIVPIPDYLMAFATPALPLSEDPYAQPPMHVKHENAVTSLQNSTVLSHAVISSNNNSKTHNIKSEKQQHTQPSQHGNIEQPTLGASLQQQQQQEFGVIHPQPYPMPFPNSSRGMDAFSIGQLLQQQSACSGGPDSDPMSFLFQPMYPSTSSALASGSYPTTAMPAYNTMAPSTFMSGPVGLAGEAALFLMSSSPRVQANWALA